MLNRKLVRQVLVNSLVGNPISNIQRDLCLTREKAISMYINFVYGRRMANSTNNGEVLIFKGLLSGEIDKSLIDFKARKLVMFGNPVNIFNY